MSKTIAPLIVKVSGFHYSLCIKREGKQGPEGMKKCYKSTLDEYRCQV
ncbi:hypothetical protein ATN83_2777 [Raoultella ornithinolytica]|nr:hypothetical protein ATN83_2777 [Raoultella ornithinolytica]KDV94113.1 hypothetical protein AB00_2257 [Raoultella ornithinolytica 2-156-04_S1_C1]KDX14343.1 hypothetical protein AB28_2446 [Raoultella ornithinolytica 2-156-04_S1_C2]